MAIFITFDSNDIVTQVKQKQPSQTIILNVGYVLSRFTGTATNCSLVSNFFMIIDHA